MFPEDLTIYPPLEHCYGWPRHGQTCTFYRGPVTVEHQDAGPVDLAGEFYFEWSRRPRATWTASESNDDRVNAGDFVLSAKATPPGVPMSLSVIDNSSLADRPAPNGRIQGTAEIGDPRDVDAVMFFLINGRKIDNLKRVGHSDQPRRSRLDVTHRDWTILIDQNPDEDMFEQLGSGSVDQAATHLCEISRSDGGSFVAQTALPAVRCIASAFSFAACRRVAAAMVLGTRRKEVRWAQVTTPGADDWNDTFTWLDPSNGYQQLTELLSCWLDAWSDPNDRETLILAAGYHLVACQSRPLDPSLSIAVSALLLLGDATRIRSNLSSTEWKNLGTGGQIRWLLTHAAIDASPVAHYPELTLTSERKHQNISKNTVIQRPPDFIDGVIELRNIIIHPDVKNRQGMSNEDLTQAWRTATEWLDLALLYYVGYRGKFATRRKEHIRWVGDVDQVPWV